MTSTAHAAPGRTVVRFEEPYFVTPHAIRRYRERVGRGSDMDIVRRINDGLQGAGPRYPTTRLVAIGDRRKRFVAIVRPPSPEYGEWPRVVSVWAWHLCPILLRRKGGPIEGWRHYRYVEDRSLARETDRPAAAATHLRSETPGGIHDDRPGTPSQAAAVQGQRRRQGRGQRRRRQEPLMGRTVVAGRGWLATSEPVPGRPGLRRFVDARVSRSLRKRLDVQVEWSRACIELWLDGLERPYVAYSGGKDSAALLHLVRSIRPDIEAVLILESDGAMPGVREAAGWWRRDGVPVHEHVWGSMIERIRDTGRASMPLGRIIRELRATYGFDGCARGLRAEESRGREMHALTHHPVRVWDDGFVEADPIIWWTAEDVWAYHALHGIPYCAIYDREDGQPRERRRIGSPWGMIGHEQGRIARLRRFDRELYQKLERVVPEIRRYT